MRTVMVMAAVFAASAVYAHHSEAPHFATDQVVQIVGVVKRWAAVNPHSRLDVEAHDASGAIVLWHCEMYGAASLREFGIDKTTFKPGERVTIKAAPGRKDPTACLVREAQLASGRLISLAPPSLEAEPKAVQVNNSIYGVWRPLAIQLPRGAIVGAPASARPQAMPAPVLGKMTPAGMAATDAYDPLRDDPTYRCSPVNPIRLWRAPDAKFSIAREGDRVVIRNEFMDAVRTVHLSQTSPPANASRTELGYSVGHFEGDALVIETSHFAAGVLMQYATDPQGRLRGVLHSDAYTLSERLSFDAAKSELVVQYSQRDPKFFTEDPPGGTARYKTNPEPSLQNYNCEPTKPQ